MGEVRRIDSLEGREGGRGGGSFWSWLGLGKKKRLLNGLVSMIRYYLS